MINIPMRFTRLIENEPELIPPGVNSPVDDVESEEDRRWDAIHELEQKFAQHYFQMYQKAGIELFDDDGIPVNVSFQEEDGMVEVQITTDDSFKLESLIALSKVGGITPTTEISAYCRKGFGEITLTTRVPAQDTPFRQFLGVAGTVSVGTASSSGSV